MRIENPDILDMEDRLNEISLQLDFLLRMLGAMSTEHIDEDLRPTSNEAHFGIVLGQRSR